MSLTYQPFAAVPEITALEEELKHNVNDTERLASVAAGVGIVAGSIFGHGLGRLLMLGAAAALIHRGITGHCMVYEKLGVTTREPQLISTDEQTALKEEGSQMPTTAVTAPQASTVGQIAQPSGIGV